MYDQGLSIGGGTNPPGGANTPGGSNPPGGANNWGAPIYDFAKFPEKLHEIERNWNEEEGGPPCHPLRSADHNIKFQLEIDLIRCNSANKAVHCQGNQTRLHLQCFYLTRIPRG